MSHPVNTPLGRFGVVTSEEGPQRCVASIPAFPDGPTGPLPPGSLADRMAVRVAESGGSTKVLVQDSDPVLNGRANQPLHTASLGVNYLGQFSTSSEGPESRYEARTLRVGRSSGVAEALSVDASGKPAIIARITAYLG